MSLYHFVAKDQNAKRITGEVEAIDERALVTTLQKQGLVPLEIREKNGAKSPASISLKNVKFALPFRGVSETEVVTFTRQLSTMISAGLPLTDALVILEKQTKSAAFARIIGQVVADVEGGASLSAALAKNPRVFSNIYVKLVESGEAGGIMDKVLLRLADSLEKSREFKAKTKGAFVYPVIVIVVMIIVVAVMMIFVIPKLTSLYTEIGAELPLPTRVLMFTSDVTRKFWWLILIFIGGVIFGLRLFSQTPSGSQVISNLALKIPIWGKIRKMLLLGEFTRTLGLLVGTGIPIITALKVVSGLLSNKQYKEGIEFTIERVERGSPLYQPLSASTVFPPIIGQMVRVGEETGKVDEVLGRLSLYFENESEHLIRNLTTALEPIILIVLGLGVGILVLSIIMPIYNLTAQF